MPDKTENERKTLANCRNSEFLPAAMRARKIVNEYYTKINVNDIVERYRNEEDENKPEAFIRLVNDVIGEIFIQFPAETVKLAAIAGFMTEEEAETVAPTDIYAIILECAFSVRCLDFFISAESMDGRNTDGIYRALILLRRIAGGMNTSDSESPMNTTDTNVNVSAGDMSEKP